MEDQREHRQPGPIGPPPTPAPSPSPPNVPGPVPWMCTDPISEVPTVRGATSPRECGVTPAWPVGEPARQPPPKRKSRPATHPDVRVLLMSRHSAAPEEAHRAHERGYTVIEEPFTPEQLCRELRGLLASPHNDSRAELRLVGQDRLIPSGGDVLAVVRRTRTDTQGDPDGANRTSKLRR